MNDLFSDLMALCEGSSTPFFFKDQVDSDGLTYRIFSYHFTDREAWLRPNALEARGIMFQMDGEIPVRIASRPMQKFFNKGEVDFIDYGEPQLVMHKVDGSLISSYTSANGISLKSKTSISSEYAQAAMALLNEDQDLFEFVAECELNGYTVNLEYVSPDPEHRIVVYYEEPKLVVLNARHRVFGSYLPMDRIPKHLFAGEVPVTRLDELDTITGEEGFVVIDDKGNWWKEKCDWYLRRHRAKDFVNQPKAFVDLVLTEEADDILELVADQPAVLAELTDLQHRVVELANGFVNRVTRYYTENSRLTAKEFAIKAKSELQGYEFNAAMAWFNRGVEPDWADWLRKVSTKTEW